MKKLLLITIIVMNLFSSLNGLSTVQISQKCHCDLTKDFCDFGCCCDLDCGTSIIVSCFNEKSRKYCPKTQFFYSIKGNKQSGNICYYYNTTQALIDQKKLSNSQRIEYINKGKQVAPIKASVNVGYKGYRLSSPSNILKIGGNSDFSFVSSTGQCLLSADTHKFSFRFGQNIKITCGSAQATNPLMFSELLGKTVPKYYNVVTESVQLPSISGIINKLTINFIIGTYGSQGIKYIDRITYSYTLGVTTSKTLSVNFIDSKNIQKQQTSAPFFPQIPIDMFYPIHMMS